MEHSNAGYVLKHSVIVWLFTRGRAGRFLQEYSADDVLFGNVFDRPLPIPWGFSAITGFMQCVELAFLRSLPLSLLEGTSIRRWNRISIPRPNHGRYLLLYRQ